MFLIVAVISATLPKSTVDAVVGSKNYSTFIDFDKTDTLLSTFQSKSPVSVLQQLMNCSSLKNFVYNN
jgi:hypothetical protein